MTTPHTTASRTAGPKPLAVTMGDPAGIGPDITLVSWYRRSELALPPFAVFGDPDMLAERAQALGLKVPLSRLQTLETAPSAFPDALPVVTIPLPERAAPGTPTPRNAAGIIAAIEQATRAVANGEATALVTNPIAKSVLTEAGFTHPGHTEFLGELAERHWPGSEAQPVMLLASDVLRVVPLTIHIPISQVPAAITAEQLKRTTRILHRALREDFGCTAPRIAIAGLNPHAGENGTIGTEDRDIIAPAIAELQNEGLAVTGPHSADTMFHAAARATYDAAIAMYHDQALIPIKTLAFDTGVNTTIGLPFIRTSPDHGTAFDRAATGTASPASFIEAIRLADRMARNRALAKFETPA